MEYKKTILFVVPSLCVGGVSRALITLLKHAPADKFAITLMTFADDKGLAAQLPEHIVRKCAPGMAWQENLRRIISEGLKKAGLHKLFSATKRLYHRAGYKMAQEKLDDNYDIAIAYADGAATWYVAKSVCAKKKLAFVHTDVKSAGYTAKQEGPIYAGFDRIIFGSEASRESFLQMLPNLRSKTALLPNKIDVEEVLCLAEEYDPFPSENGQIKIVSVGRLSHEKGMGLIPELLRRLKDDGKRVRWYIVGDGPERNSILQQAKVYDVEEMLVLTGVKENPYPYVRGCDIYVQPSRYEGFCIALTEARALCRPAVACDFAGAREQIKNGHTGFVTGMSVDSLYDGVRKLVELEQLRSTFSDNLMQERVQLIDQSCIREFWNGLRGN